VQAVVGQLTGLDIVSYPTSGCGLGKQLRDEFAQLLVGVGDMLALVQPHRQRAAVRDARLVVDVGVGMADRFEPTCECQKRCSRHATC
jgi:hypothetical protein